MASTAINKRHTKLKCIKIRAKPEEKAVIAKLANDCGLSVSSYAKRLCPNYHPRNNMDNENFKNLMRVDGDQGRVGDCSNCLSPVPIFSRRPNGTAKR
jgi:hypothetical protein